MTQPSTNGLRERIPDTQVRAGEVAVCDSGSMAFLWIQVDFFWSRSAILSKNLAQKVTEFSSTPIFQRE